MNYEWEFDRSVHSVRNIANFANEYGYGYKEILERTGLNFDQLLDPNIIISGSQELQLISNILNLFDGQSALGMEIGTRYHFTTYGSLGLAWISCENIRQGLDVALTYFPLTFAFTEFQILEEEQSLYIDIKASEGVPRRLWQFVIERDISALLTILKDLTQDNLCQNIFLTFASPKNLDFYTDICGVIPEFEATKNCVVLDANKVKEKRSTSNELALLSAIEQCKLALENRKNPKKFTLNVQSILMESHGKIPTMEEVSNSLYCNSRTLRRRLAKEGTTFIKIREEARKILATNYLYLSYISISQIAECLGYKETSSFIHAYRRWYSKTPHAMRLLLRK